MAFMTTSNRQDPLVSRGRGRPREFDLAPVLDRAIEVFSERGYQATSITDLTKAMGLSQGSLYKAFKDKRAVFLAAFDHYRERRTRQLRDALGADGTGRERLRRALLFYAESAQGEQGRQGCLVVGSAISLSAFDADMAAHITDALERNEELVADLLRQGQADGSLRPELPIDATARTLLCLTQGIRVVGKTGRSREELQAVVEVAMRVID